MKRRVYDNDLSLQVFTEQIRLIDGAKVGSQTDEDGEIYRWLKYQAGLGVVSAQVRKSIVLPHVEWFNWTIIASLRFRDNNFSLVCFTFFCRNLMLSVCRSVVLNITA